jgi:hypothetical protein
MIHLAELIIATMVVVGTVCVIAGGTVYLCISIRHNQAEKRERERRERAAARLARDQSTSN